MTERNHYDGTPYSDLFSSVKDKFPGANISWLNDLRKNAMERFLEIGIPGPKVEEWKYSNLSFLKSADHEVSFNGEESSQFSKSADELFISDFTGSKVVFCNGIFDDKASVIKSQDGIKFLNINDFIKNNADEAKKLLSGKIPENGLRDLNLAFMGDGYVLSVDKDIKLVDPIQIIHVVTAGFHEKAISNRNYIHLSANSSATIIEHFVGEKDIHYWSHNLTKVVMEKDADLSIYQFQNESDNAIHLSETLIDLEKSANFNHYSLNIGGKLSRTEIKPTLSGIHGNVNLRGAFLGREGASHDVFTHMKHMVPECESDQVYRGVLDKGGKSAFQGRVYVAKDAQLTNADQSNKNLILDRSAEANSKPELLIYADDVKCSHGATVGELDKDALFYLKSRGLDHHAAKALLVEAFVAEVFEDISIDAVKNLYFKQARSWLSNEG